MRGLVILLLAAGCAAANRPDALDNVCPLDTRATPPIKEPTSRPASITLLLQDGSRRPLRAGMSNARMIDASGRDRFFPFDSALTVDSLPAGALVVRTRALGYQARIDTFIVSEARGERAILILRLSGLDECGFATAKKPWWKFW